MLYQAKPLFSLGYGILLVLAATGSVMAQDVTTPVPAPTAGTSASGNPATPADSQQQQQSPDNAQLPGTLPNNTYNLQNAYSPLLPYQGNNPYSPYATTSNNPQSPQLTAPSVFITGARDLSQISTTDALTQAFSEQASTGFDEEQGLSYSHPPIERILLGPFDLKAAMSFNTVSDDNLQSGEAGEGKKSDTSFNLTPAILLQYGTHEGQKGIASLVYAPSFTRYVHSSSEDSDNQNVAFHAAYPFDRLSLDFAQTYTEVTGFNQDQNARTSQTSSITSFGGNYDVDDKISVTAGVQHVITSFSAPGGGSSDGNTAESQGQGDTTSSANTSVSYHLSDKMSLNANANVGVDKPEDSKQFTYEQTYLGVNYIPTEKISCFAQGGLEFQQGTAESSNFVGSQNNSSGTVVNPIFSFGLGYTPFDSTSFALTASQSVHSSSAVGEGNVVNTGVGFSATQRFFQRLYLNLAFDYYHQDTQDSGTSTTTSSGSQDSFSYRPSLSIAPTAWSTVAVYYQYIDNQSDQVGGNYHDNQVGLSLSVEF